MRGRDEGMGRKVKTEASDPSTESSSVTLTFTQEETQSL